MEKSDIPIDAESIPTGEIASVEGTPFDFRQRHLIGERIGWENEQLSNARGYDHNWCIDKTTDGVELVCRVEDRVSGRWVEILSDQPETDPLSKHLFCIKGFSNQKCFGLGQLKHILLDMIRNTVLPLRATN